MTLNDLHTLLAEVPPAQLIALDLLTCPNPDRETLKAAVLELVAYTDACQRAAEQLRTLTPIPLTTVDLLEFGL